MKPEIKTPKRGNTEFRIQMTYNPVPHVNPCISPVVIPTYCSRYTTPPLCHDHRSLEWDGRTKFRSLSCTRVTPNSSIPQDRHKPGRNRSRCIRQESPCAPFTDSTQVIQFPVDGQMYVILFNMSTNYLVVRKDITDLGVVFGQCGYYLCYECCLEYKKDITATTVCCYCRVPVVINLDTLVENNEDDTDQPGPEPALSPGTQIKCMFSLLKKL